MICGWKELLSVLPQWMRKETDNLGRGSLQELRLRLHSPPELILKDSFVWLNRIVSEDDLRFCVNAASQYSPWAASTASKGYLTAPGGHRIGLCGTAVVSSGTVTGIRDLTSLCIRVARDFPGISQSLLGIRDNVLILGAPGWGKTTLLRDLSRQTGEEETVCVVDERGELFPAGLIRGKRMDVLLGCPKRQGIEMALRTMGPSCIALDEITSEEDCNALIQAANCGVRLQATAHAGSLEDYKSRSVYRKLRTCKLFGQVVMLRPDKSFSLERILL